MWEILVSRKFAIRDEPNVRFRCASNFHFSLVSAMKNTRLTTTSSPLPLCPTLSLSPFTVYTFKTSPWMRAPRAQRGAGMHRSFQRVTHHTHPTHHNPPHPPHHTETDTERDRDKERRGDEREEDREDKTTEERTEKIHFQCGGAWPLLVGVVIFWLVPFAHET